jgi:hypothetical protein
MTADEPGDLGPEHWVVASGDGAGNADDRDEAARRWLERCRELARGEHDGIENPAWELSELAHGDRRVMELARRAILEGLEADPDDHTLRQMRSFWRRAFEKGTWDWDGDATDAGGIL